MKKISEGKVGFMRLPALGMIFATCALGGLAKSSAAEAPPYRTDREWKVLMHSLYSKGMTRAEVERKLGANLFFELADRQYNSRRDVYYDLDSTWCAFFIYRPVDRVEEGVDRTDPLKMIIVTRPLLIRKYPNLLDDLKKQATPVSLPAVGGQINRRETY